MATHSVPEAHRLARLASVPMLLREDDRVLRLLFSDGAARMSASAVNGERASCRH